MNLLTTQLPFKMHIHLQDRQNRDHKLLSVVKNSIALIKIIEQVHVLMLSLGFLKSWLVAYLLI